MERTILIIHARVESQEYPLAQIVRDHMLLHIEGVQNTKNRRSDNMWLAAKNHTPQY